MPKFIVISGPQAVGKMTVGQELEKITNLKLFHNHMTIEILTKLFDYSQETFRRLNLEIRDIIFEEFSKSNEYGMIFTTCFDFDSPKEREKIENWIETFSKRGGETYFIELEASLEERLKRNKTENRLNNKPSKRNLEWSEQDVLNSSKKHRLNSYENEELNFKNYYKICNENISAKKVAYMIKEKFQL